MSQQTKRNTVIYVLLGILIIFAAWWFYNNSGNVSQVKSLTSTTETMQNKVSNNDNQETRPATEVGYMSAQVTAVPPKKGIEQSDAILQVRILNVFKEVDEPTPSTLFNAEIIRSLKGKLQPKEIIKIKKIGNSKWIYGDNNQFQIDKEYILILKEAWNKNI